MLNKCKNKINKEIEAKKSRRMCKFFDDRSDKSTHFAFEETQN
jgi:hypothetical protein